MVVLKLKPTEATPCTLSPYLCIQAKIIHVLIVDSGMLDKQRVEEELLFGEHTQVEYSRSRVRVNVLDDEVETMFKVSFPLHQET